MLQRFLLSILLVSTCLLASAEDVQATYEKGLKSYKSKDFQSSFELFNTIYFKKLDDINFNFYFGRSAYETGNYEKALAAFERVEIYDGTNIRNKLEMARTYFMLKMYEDSENAYLEVLANPNIPENIRTDIELSLSKVSKVQKKSFTYATVLADILYDSNVNYGSIGDYEFSNTTFGRIPELDSTALQVYANVTNIYDIGRKNGYGIKNSFSFYLKDYTEHNLYDVIYLAYNPSLIYKETLYTAELVLGFDTLVLGKNKFLSSTSIMPRLEYNHSSTLRSIAYLKLQQKKFEREAQHDLDARRLELSYGLQNLLSPRSYVQGNVFLINENALRGSNIYVNYNEYKVNASYANQLTSTYGINVHGQLRNRKYKDFSSGFNSVRNDVGTLINFDVTMKVMPKLRLKLGTSFEYVDSNQERFSYKKHIISAGIVKTF